MEDYCCASDGKLICKIVFVLIFLSLFEFSVSLIYKQTLYHFYTKYFYEHETVHSSQPYTKECNGI